MWSQKVPRLDNSQLSRSPWPAGFRAATGEEGPALPLLSSAFTAAQVEAWLEGLLLLLAFAGPAGDDNKALLRRCIRCQDC